ncbi:hypothetical protein AAG583_27065 [Klebsiella variicola]
MGSCAAPSAKGDDKFITTDYLQQCPLLQYLSPLGWEHINLTGDYLWRSSAKIGAGKFRPLRPLQPA